MSWYIIKILITAGIITAASEVAKMSDRLGSLITALPLISILTMFWIFFESQGNEKIANHAWFTFWYALPTMPMFLLFPILINKFGFAIAMVLSIIITLICFRILNIVMVKFGI